MKKLLVLVILHSLLLFSCSDKTIESIENPNSKPYEKITVSQEDIELEKIKENPVNARLTYSKFSEEYVPAGSKEVLAERINYNEEGQRAEYFRYISNGDVDLQWLYDYDYYGRLTSVETFDGYRKRIYHKILSYNNDGTLEKVEEWNEKSKDYITTKYFYNDSNYIVNTNFYNQKGELEFIDSYFYKNNKLDSLSKVTRDKEFVSSIKFEYDSLGRRVREQLKNDAGKVVTTDYKYDSDNNVLEIKNSVLSSYKYEYDDNNNVILELELNSGGFIQSKFEYIYDKSTGFVKDKIRYDGEDRKALLIRYEYE